jgi:aspartate aminotransferase
MPGKETAAVISRRVQAVAPSLTLAITAKAAALKAAGEDVVGFGAGEPDFDTPQPIKDAAIRAIQDGRTKYTAVDGIAELKTAIAERIRVEHGISIKAPGIAVTVGAKQAIYNLLLAAVNPGDGVLIPAPYWVSYPDMVRLADGEPQIVETHAEDNFVLRPEALEAAIQPNSKILILNAPSNPTGAAMTQDELAAVAEVALRHNLYVISDEIYDKLVYDGFQQHSIAGLPGMAERTAIVNGVSKTYAMTGWRIGWIAGPEAWVRASVKLQGQSTSNPSSISQYATLAALALGADVIQGMVDEFQRRRNRIVELLNAIPGVDCLTPQGAFYVFPDIREAIAGRWADDNAFADALIQEAKVAVVPGSGFGADGFMRLSYATSMEDIEKGVARIDAFLRA